MPKNIGCVNLSNACFLLLKRVLLIAKNLNHNKNADWNFMLCIPCKTVSVMQYEIRCVCIPI